MWEFKIQRNTKVKLAITCPKEDLLGLYSNTNKTKDNIQCIHRSCWLSLHENIQMYDFTLFCFCSQEHANWFKAGVFFSNY